MPMTWQFYGRDRELERLTSVLQRQRWFFARITGRRRIGKTSLAQEALKRSGRRKVLYIRVPESDPAGVLATTRDFYDLFAVPGARPTDLRTLARDIARLVRDGWIVALDEFQYFRRKALYEFTSHLQSEVDRLAAEASTVNGGLVVLGSNHAEMTALLENHSAPLFNRVTDELDMTHLDVASVLQILRTHGTAEPHRLLFLWNLFEGVPKFYRDCFEQNVLNAPRSQLIETMFFSSSSPLRNEADDWCLRALRGLRGRYESVLKLVATHPGCTNGDIDAHARAIDPGSAKQVRADIKALCERFGIIDRVQPILSKPTSRKGRLYITDNFLRCWLAALQTTTAAVHFLPLPKLVSETSERLKEAEGHGLERLVATLYAERSRKGVGDFGLTHRMEGFWDKADRSGALIELDLVALDEQSKAIRLGICKRQADKLLAALPRFDRHVGGFLTASPKFASWTIQRVAFAPLLTQEKRSAIEAAGYLAQDLDDLTLGL